jgi:LmbE family N-acetylglucosaminyl deacetylase
MKLKNKSKSLLIFAHPDDEILGMGGFIAKNINKSFFKVIFIAEGSSCRFPENESNSEKVLKNIKLRNKMAVNSLNFLGIKNITFCDLPCGMLDQISILKINKIIEAEIKSIKPDNIFTHSPIDCNNDHRIVHRSVMMATRPSAINKNIKKIFSCEILSSTEWSYTETFSPNYFEILSSKNIKKKIKAMKIYNSEYQKEPYPRNSRGIETLAAFRGLQAGHKYAEGFKLIKFISE